jgi:hypothetical protein
MCTLRLFLLLLTVVMYPLAASSGPGPGGGGHGGHGGGDDRGGGHRSADDIVTPEPSTWVLMGTGVAGVLVRAAYLKRRKKGSGA